MLLKSRNDATQEAVENAAHMAKSLDMILADIFAAEDEEFKNDTDKALCAIVGVLDELDRAIEVTEDLDVDSIWMTGVLLEISDFRDKMRARTEPHLKPTQE